MSKPSTHTAPRTHRLLALLWPALALLACAALWTAAVLRANAEQRRAEEQAFKEADAYAEAYEQYVTRSIAQMDQITMQLKHSWEHSHSRALVEDMRRDGMFTDSAFVAVGVIGRDGRPASTSGMRPGLDTDLSAPLSSASTATTTLPRCASPCRRLSWACAARCCSRAASTPATTNSAACC